MPDQVKTLLLGTVGIILAAGGAGLIWGFGGALLTIGAALFAVSVSDMRTR